MSSDFNSNLIGSIFPAEDLKQNYKYKNLSCKITKKLAEDCVFILDPIAHNKRLIEKMCFLGLQAFICMQLFVINLNNHTPLYAELCFWIRAATGKPFMDCIWGLCSS